MAALSAEEQRLFRVLFAWHARARTGLGLRQTWVVFLVLPPVGLVLSAAAVESAQDAPSAWAPVAFAGAVVLAALWALHEFRMRDLSHPGGPILALLPPVPVASRFAEVSLLRMVWANLGGLCAALPAYGFLLSHRLYDSADAVLALVVVGPAIAVCAALATRLFMSLPARPMAYDWAAWSVLTGFAFGPAVGLALGWGPEAVAFSAGPFALLFAVLSWAAAEGPLAALVAFVATNAVGALLAWDVPHRVRTPDDPANKRFTQAQQKHIEEFVEDLTRRLEEKEGDGPEPVHFGRGPRAALIGQEAPTPRSAGWSQARGAATVVAILLGMAVLVIATLQARPLFATVGLGGFAAAGVVLAASAAAAVRFPGMSPGRRLERAMRRAESKLAEEPPKRRASAGNFQGWSILQTMPIPLDVMDEAYLRDARRELRWAPAALVGFTIVGWLLTGAPLVSAGFVLGMGTAMGGIYWAIEAADAPVRGGPTPLRVAYRAGVAAVAVGAFSFAFLGMAPIRLGLDRPGAWHEFLLLGGSLVAMAGLALFGMRLKREQLVIAWRPYAGPRRTAVVWATAACLFAVAVTAALGRGGLL